MLSLKELVQKINNSSSYEFLVNYVKSNGEPAFNQLFAQSNSVTFSKTKFDNFRKAYTDCVEEMFRFTSNNHQQRKRLFTEAELIEYFCPFLDGACEQGLRRWGFANGLDLVQIEMLRDSLKDF